MLTREHDIAPLPHLHLLSMATGRNGPGFGRGRAIEWLGTRLRQLIDRGEHMILGRLEQIACSLFRQLLPEKIASRIAAAMSFEEIDAMVAGPGGWLVRCGLIHVPCVSGARRSRPKDGVI